MTSKYIFSLKHDRLPASAGGKAYYLRSLLEKGFPVPETFVCTWQAYELDGRRLQPIVVTHGPRLVEDDDHMVHGPFALPIDQKVIIVESPDVRVFGAGLNEGLHQVHTTDLVDRAQLIPLVYPLAVF